MRYPSVLFAGAACAVASAVACGGDNLVLPSLTPPGGAKLGVATQPPTQATAGAALTPQPSVQVQDAAGAPVAKAGIAVTAALDGTTAQLRGQLTQPTDTSGVARFTDLTIDGPAGSYTIRFSSAGLAPVAARPVDLVVLHIATTATIRSLSPARGTALMPVTVSFAVTASSGATPDGTVTVSDDTDGCSASVSAGSCAYTPSTGGDKTVTVTYPGTGSFDGSRASAPYRVDRLGTTAAAPDVQPGPYFSINATVTLSTHVAAERGSVQGTITFVRGSCGTDGEQLGKAVQVQADGSATVTAQFSTVGTSTVYACYAGNATFAPTTSPPTAVFVYPW